MSLPYQSSTSGDRAIGEIQKVLRSFGCTQFAWGEDYDAGEIFVQFQHRDRRVHMCASSKGYAAAWLRENPWNHRRRATREKWNARALKIGSVAVYSVLRDWVKAQTTAIECGILSFEGAFLGHIQMVDGRTVLQAIESGDVLPGLGPGGDA